MTAAVRLEETSHLSSEGARAEQRGTWLRSSIPACVRPAERGRIGFDGRRVDDTKASERLRAS